ncbi:hypothetical protein P7J41_09670 [Streptococcus suis]
MAATSFVFLFEKNWLEAIIMTTRQTGGLNKGYKPTSPASA